MQWWANATRRCTRATALCSIRVRIAQDYMTSEDMLAVGDLYRRLVRPELALQYYSRSIEKILNSSKGFTDTSSSEAVVADAHASTSLPAALQRAADGSQQEKVTKVRFRQPAARTRQHATHDVTTWSVQHATENMQRA
jgi:hypothetical protein